MTDEQDDDFQLASAWGKIFRLALPNNFGGRINKTPVRVVRREQVAA